MERWAPLAPWETVAWRKPMRVLSSRLALALVAALLLSLIDIPASAPGARLGAAEAQAFDLSAAQPELLASPDDPDIVDDLGKVKRGKKAVLVKVDVGQSGVDCQMKVKYVDGNTDSPNDVSADNKGLCLISFDVPDRDSVLGLAQVKVRVVKKKNGKVDEVFGRTSRLFTVRDRR
jgi:hypothetical protein